MFENQQALQQQASWIALRRRKEMITGTPQSEGGGRHNSWMKRGAKGRATQLLDEVGRRETGSQRAKSKYRHRGKA